MAGAACIVAAQGRGGGGGRKECRRPILYRDGLLPFSVIVFCSFRVLGGRGRLGEGVLFVVDAYKSKSGAVFHLVVAVGACVGFAGYVVVVWWWGWSGRCCCVLVSMA